MSHSDHTTRRTNETSKQESVQEPCSAARFITDHNAEEQNDEMEKVFTGKVLRRLPEKPCPLITTRVKGKG